jgi:outer membrane protein OmpA-like peptidoglycan-associated protein
MAKSCKCKEAECEECPEWIFTFADLVMLMMGFFVILWVLKPPAGKSSSGSGESAAAEEKWLDTVGEIRQAFGYLPDPTSKDPVDRSMLEHKKIMFDPSHANGMGGNTTVKPQAPQGTEPDVQSLRPGKHVIVGARIMFEKGSDALPDGATKQLDQMVKIIQGHRQIFLVKGHTGVDDLPETATSQQKMDLSVRRAQVVADYLGNHGVDPQILRVEGCSTFEPVAERAYSDTQRSQNRRVEVEGTDTPVGERQDNQKTTLAQPFDLNQASAKD